MRFRFFVPVLLLLVSASTSLSAYDPARFSPLDIYMTKPRDKGPKTIQVIDAAGKVRQTAILDYDASGFLLRETYTDADNKPQGSVVYHYKDALLTEERSLSATGNLLSRRAFQYKNGKLSGIISYDAKGEIVSRFVYTFQADRLVSGAEVHSPDKDRFAIEYAGAAIAAVSYASPDGKPISVVRFTYGPQGQVVERERTFGPARNVCRYQYDASGRIVSYSYFELINGGWVLEKTLRLGY